MELMGKTFTAASAAQDWRNGMLELRASGYASVADRCERLRGIEVLARQIAEATDNEGVRVHEVRVGGDFLKTLRASLGVEE